MTAVPVPISSSRAHRDPQPASPKPSGEGGLPPGTGALQFEKVRGTTVLTRAIAASPLRLLHPKNSGAAAWVYAATFGGGLLGGDAIDMDVTVGPGASALLSTQASTKVYRSDGVATQHLRARAGDDAVLVLLPDPVTPFAGSSYQQQQHIDLSPQANLVAVDWMTAGRVSSGERWQFTSYASRTWLRRDGRVILQDATLLSNEDLNNVVAQRMGRFTCIAWAVVIGPAVRAAAVRLAGSLADAPVSKRADVLLAAAPLEEDGVLLRVAGVSTQQVGAVLKQHLNFVPSLLGDDPWRIRT